MLKMNISKLMDAFREVKEFTLPPMDKEVQYLYTNLYQRMADNESVYVEDLDYGNFEPDDLNTLRDIYRLYLEDHPYKVSGVIKILTEIAPKASKTNFI